MYKNLQNKTAHVCVYGFDGVAISEDLDLIPGRINV